MNPISINPCESGHISWPLYHRETDKVYIYYITKVIDLQIQKSFSVGGSMQLQTIGGPIILPLQTQYLGKSMEGLELMHPPLDPPMLYKCM